MLTDLLLIDDGEAGATPGIAVTVTAPLAIGVTLSIAPGGGDVSDYIPLYPHNTQLPAVTLKPADGSSGVGATVHAEVLPLEGSAVIASTDITVTDNGDDTYSLDVADTPRDAIKPGWEYTIHVWGSLGDAEFDTRNRALGKRRAAQLA